jgi:hypothetical protein
VNEVSTSLGIGSHLQVCGIALDVAKLPELLGVVVKAEEA